MKRLLSFLPALILLLAACGGKGSDKKARLAELKKKESEISAEIRALEKELGSTSEARKAKLVITDELKPEKFVHFVHIQGRVDATDNVVVNAKMPGTVVRILVKEGQTVKAGQLLAETDASAYLSGLEEARTGLNFATTLFEKQKSLWDQKIGTEVQFLQAKNAKEQAEKRIATLNEQIAMTRVVSPISGVVDEVMLRLGQPASPGVPNNGIRVVNMGNVKVKADVAEAYSQSIRPGSDVTVEFPDAGKTVRSTLHYVSKQINPMTRTFGVEAELAPDPSYQANMVAVLKIVDYSAKDALAVPINLVQNSEEGTYVMVAETKGNETVAQRKAVKTGKTGTDRVEILEGLKSGDRLITVGYQELNEGDLLQVK